MIMNSQSRRDTTSCNIQFISLIHLLFIIPVITFSPPTTFQKMTLHSQQLNGKSITTTTTQDESAVTTRSNKPLLTFGLLADIQYAPIPDGFSYNGTPRYYRHALQAAKYAAKHFEEEKVDFVVNLGKHIFPYLRFI